MRIAICDDNKEELSSIQSILDIYIYIYYQQNILITYKAFQNAAELLDTAKNGSYDLYILDIIMPGISGMDVAREIRSFDKTANIMFLTSAPEFAIEGYSVKACNYILKPVVKEKLFAALDDIMDTADQKQEDSIVVKSNDGIVKIALSQLTHVEALNRKVVYYLASGKTVECTAKFAQVCEELGQHKEFTQTHRCYMVNMGYINKIKNAEIVLQSGVSLPIAQRKVAEIKKQYLAFQMED